MALFALMLVVTIFQLRTQKEVHGKHELEDAAMTRSKTVEILRYAFVLIALAAIVPAALRLDGLAVA